MSIEITLWGIIWNLPLINYRIALCSAWDDDSPRQCYIKWCRAGSSIRLFRGQTDSNWCKTVQTGAKRCTEKDMLMITARIEDYLSSLRLYFLHYEKLGWHDHGPTSGIVIMRGAARIEDYLLSVRLYFLHDKKLVFWRASVWCDNEISHQ